MKTELLRAALKEFLNNHELNKADQTEIFSAINELDEIDQGAGADDVYEHDIYFVHASVAADLINIALYDVYGRLDAESNGQPQYADFYNRSENLLPAISSQLIDLGWSLISDLYSDNKQSGCHNPDGTFRCGNN